MRLVTTASAVNSDVVVPMKQAVIMSPGRAAVPPAGWDDAALNVRSSFLIRSINSTVE